MSGEFGSVRVQQNTARVFNNLAAANRYLVVSNGPQVRLAPTHSHILDRMVTSSIGRLLFGTASLCPGTAAWSVKKLLAQRSVHEARLRAQTFFGGRAPGTRMA